MIDLKNKLNEKNPKDVCAPAHKQLPAEGRNKPYANDRSKEQSQENES